MSVKAGFPCALLLSVLVAGAGRCEDPPRPDPAGFGAPPAPADVAPGPTFSATPPPVPDAYILRECPGCCGPVGKHGPITYELYFRTGLSMPVDGSGLAHTISTGWRIQ